MGEYARAPTNMVGAKSPLLPPILSVTPVNRILKTHAQIISLFFDAFY
jgi:hypothetical protein